LPPESRALALVRNLHPHIYTDTRGKEIVAFPPDYEPISVNSRRLRGIIAHLFESTYGPEEMLSEKAAKRVEMQLTGEAAKNTSPVVAGPLSLLQDHDPLLLSVYYYMLRRHDDNLECYKDYTTAIMKEVVKAAPTFGIPADLIPGYAPVFGKRLMVLIPQLLELGLEVKYQHRKRGTCFTMSWKEPPEDPDDVGEPSSSTLSPGKPNEIKPLRRSDGREAVDLSSKLAALNQKDEASET